MNSITIAYLAKINLGAPYMLVDFLSQYGLFLAKVLTVVFGVLFIVAATLVLISRQKQSPEGTLRITDLSHERKILREHLQAEILHKSIFKKWMKTQKAAQKAAQKAEQKTANKKDAPSASQPRAFVVRFDGDIRASQVKALRQVVTAILTIAQPEDEVVLVLESGGGVVHGYGLAAAQLDRLRQQHIHLTVAIDKVAASGGYMMAVVGNVIVASPFAIVGSIGVVGQLPNFHRFLNKHDIDYELQTAGEYKRTLTLFGENTDKAREKFQQEIDETQRLFKNFIEQYRPQVNIEQVATGEHWHALDALGYQLIDQIMTSDDLITNKIQSHQVYELAYEEPQSLPHRLFSGMSMMMDNLLEKIRLFPIHKAGL